MTTDPKDIEFLPKGITNYKEGEEVNTLSNKKIIILKIEKNAFGNLIVLTKDGKYYQVNLEKPNEMTRFYPQDKWKF